jgi:hypothetical protein
MRKGWQIKGRQVGENPIFNADVKTKVSFAKVSAALWR